MQVQGKKNEAAVPTEPQKQTPKCVAIAEAGIQNSQQTIRFLSALVADISSARVTTGQAHANCNALGKMLRVAELEARYGTVGANQEKVLHFIAPEEQNGHAADLRAAAISKLSADERMALGIR